MLVNIIMSGIMSDNTRPLVPLIQPALMDAMEAVSMNSSCLLNRSCNGSMIEMKLSEAEIKKGLCFYVRAALRMKVVDCVISCDDNSKPSYFCFASILQGLLDDAAGTAACDGSKIVKLIVDLSKYDSITGMDNVRKCISMKIKISDVQTDKA